MNRLELMKSYLPEHFAESPEIIAILEDGNRRFAELDAAMDDVLNQFFVQTATWGLERWEEELEILPTSTDFVSRRKQIFGKLIHQTPTNYKAIEKEVDRFLKSPASTVRLIDKRYAFEVTFPIRDFIGNKKEMIRMVEQIKPAHLRALFVGEFLIGALRVINDSYRFPLRYSETGEFVPERDYSQIDGAPINIQNNSYGFEIEYTSGGRGVSQTDAGNAKLSNDSYNYKTEYPETGEADLLQKNITSLTRGTSVAPASYDFASRYPECGDYELEGGD